MKNNILFHTMSVRSCRSFFLAGIPIVCLLCSSCTTLQEYRTQEVRDENQRESIVSDVAMLKERIHGVEVAQEQLAAELRDLKTLMSRETSQNRASLEAMQQQVRQMEAANASLEKNIVETLSVRMAEVLRAQSASSGSRRTAPSDRSGKTEHVVESGQTLRQIANKYGVTTDAIMQANAISDANLIRVGQKLVIP